MKFSKFNVLKSDDIDTYIFNTLTGSFVRLSNENYNSLWSSEGKEIREGLLNEGILTENPNEVFAYKYRYYKEMFNPQKVHLCIAPTMKCNFNCFYCFEEGNKNLPLMNEAVENAIIRYIEKNKENDISISWFGGEPLLGFERIVSMSETLNRKNIQYTSSIITNGSLLTRKKIKQLNLLNLTYIQISLDGLADVHDRRRCFKSGVSSFDLILSNIRNFIELTDIPLHIQVTIDKTNSTAYYDLLSLFKNDYPSLINHRIQIGCNFVQNRNEFEGCSVCFDNNEIYNKQIESLSKEFKNDLNPFLPALALPCMYRCSKTFAIDPSGDVYKCLEHLGNSCYKVGNILEGKFSLNRMSETAFQEDPFDDRECLNCNVLPVCGGGCPLDRIKHKENADKDCCSIYKTKLQEMLPYLYKYKKYNL